MRGDCSRNDDRYFGPNLPLNMSKAALLFSMNDSSKVSKVLLDRMDIVTFTPYSVDDKVQIAKLHLLPRAMKRVQLCPGDLSITDEALKKIVSTVGLAQTGVRYLERALEDIVQETIIHKQNLRDIFPGKYLKNTVAWDCGKLIIDESMVNEVHNDSLSEGCPPLSMYA